MGSPTVTSPEPEPPQAAQEPTAPKRSGFPWKPKPLPEDERRQVVAGVLDGAFPSPRFYVLLALSTTIAAFGLLANSAAVIIGAMIVAPLMGPILGMALGMISANHALERRSLIAEASGVGLAIGIAMLIGMVPLNPGISAEMIARTSPTVLDLGIALASGLAAGYATINRRINSALAGVAIAVALVPPLATCGLLLAMGQPAKGFGAFLLFLANFFCIQTAAAGVFLIFGLNRPQVVAEMGPWRYRLRFAPSFLAIGLMAWFMTGTLISVIRDHDFEAKLTNVLADQIARRTGGQLDRILQRYPSSGNYVVVASALTPKVFDAEQVRQIEQELRRKVRGDLTLILRSVVSQDMNDEGRVYLSNAEKEDAARSAEALQFLDTARKALNEQLATHEGATLDSLERQDQKGETEPLLVAVVRAPKPVDPKTVEEAESALALALKRRVRLIIRNVVTRVVDRSGELYTPAPENEAAPDPAMVKLRSRIQTVMEKRMEAKIARHLLSVDLKKTDAGWHATAVTEATQPVRPAEVAAIQADLRRYVDPGITLTIRTELASVADGTHWVGP